MSRWRRHHEKAATEREYYLAYFYDIHVNEIMEIPAGIIRFALYIKFEYEI